MSAILGRATTMEGMLHAAWKLLEKEPVRFQLRPSDRDRIAGLVILEALQVGCLVGAQTGTGILLRHDQTTDTWSPPLAIGLTGVQVGMMAGIEKKHMVIFLYEDNMNVALSNNFSFRLGMENSLAVLKGGGEDVGAFFSGKGKDKVRGTTSSKESTIGIYFGTAADGTAVAPRHAINEKFYGQKVDPKTIVFGSVEAIMPDRKCEELDRLHAKLKQLVHTSPIQESVTVASTK